jgi:hypothetical protein
VERLDLLLSGFSFFGSALPEDLGDLLELLAQALDESLKSGDLLALFSFVASEFRVERALFGLVLSELGDQCKGLLKVHLVGSTSLGVGVKSVA